jgi:hypothetical protein
MPESSCAAAATANAVVMRLHTREGSHPTPECSCAAVAAVLRSIHRELTGLDPTGSILAACALSLYDGRLYVRASGGAVVEIAGRVLPDDHPIVREFARADAD